MGLARLSLVVFLFLLSLSCKLAVAILFDEIDDGYYQSFITRPDLKAPKYNITTYNAAKLSPGYWFVAPYPKLDRWKTPWQWPVCVFGAQMVDGDGELIWSAACDFDNRNSFDFRVVDLPDNNSLLSFLVQTGPPNALQATGVILNNRFEVVKKVIVDNDINYFNVHEFYVKDGKTALSVTQRSRVAPAEPLGFPPGSQVGVLDDKIVEIDINNNEVIFSWSSVDHIPLNESTHTWPERANGRGAWDFVHFNSIDKFANGDYLISARHSDTLYRVSHLNGNIVWRLGGKSSSFQQHEFNFSTQHDARILSEDPKGIIISLMNNAAGDEDNKGKPTSSCSAGLIVSLDETTMNAYLVQRYNRPDGGLTHAKGSVQRLPNDNVLIGWSDKGYQSEHTHDGELLQEATFTPYSTYRVYKFPFVGYPTKPPDVKCFAYGDTRASALTVCYMSWNGATEVKEWKMYGANAGYPNRMTLLVTCTRTGFESMCTAGGYFANVVVEAWDGSGRILKHGRSNEVVTEVPASWNWVEEEADEETPLEESEEVIALVGARNIAVLFGILLGLLLSSLVLIIVLIRRRRTTIPYDALPRIEDSEEDLPSGTGKRTRREKGKSPVETEETAVLLEKRRELEDEL